MKAKRTPERLLDLIIKIGITPNIRKQLRHRTIRWSGDVVVIPSHAVEVNKYTRSFIASTGEIMQPKPYKVMAWIEGNILYYSEYNPSIKHMHEGEWVQNYQMECQTI